MLDMWLEQIARMISANLWIAPLLALVAGMLTSFRKSIKVSHGISYSADWIIYVLVGILIKF